MNRATPLLFTLLFVVSAQAFAANPYHHMHLTASDPAAAADWYATHFDGVKQGGPFNSVMIGETAFLFLKRKPGFEGSVGSAVDHIGFSVADIDAKMTELEAAGVEITQPVRSVGELKFGFIVDPWGTSIEMIQDPDLLGFHHIHLHTPDRDATLKWYAEVFGGEVENFKGVPFLPSIRYDKVWLIVQQVPEAKAGTKGRSIDHLSWSVTDMAASLDKYRADGVKVGMGPVKLGPTTIGFIEDPLGVSIELVQVP